jgi:CheY-like chemotaxis protein
MLRVMIVDDDADALYRTQQMLRSYRRDWQMKFCFGPEPALDALGAEPELTWLVGDDAESDVRPAQLFGMRTALVRTGKFRPDTLERLDVTPDAVLSSIADLPGWLDRAI